MTETQIDEVMKAVADLEGAIAFGTLRQIYAEREAVRAKLREVRRKPLSDEQLREYVQYASISGRWAEPYAAGIRWGIRHYERLHGIGEPPCEQPSS